MRWLFTLFICILSFLYIAFPQLQWVKYYQSPDTVYTCASYQDIFISQDNGGKLIMPYTLFSKNQYRWGGLLITDLDGNVLKNHYNINFNYYNTDGLALEKNQIRVLASVDPGWDPRKSSPLPYSHQLIYNNDLEIIDEINIPYNPVLWFKKFAVYFYADQINILGDKPDDQASQRLTLFSVMPDMLTVLDSIDLEYIKSGNLKSTWISPAIKTKSNHYIILVKEYNATKSYHNNRHYDQTNLKMINSKGVLQWSTIIKYGDKKTTLHKVIEDTEGDFYIFGTTLPILPDSTYNKPPVETYLDSLLIVKISSAGKILWMKEHPFFIRTDYTPNYDFAILNDGKNLAFHYFYIHEVKVGDSSVIKTEQYIDFFDSEGSLLYKKLWQFNGMDCPAIGSMASIGDNIFIYGITRLQEKADLYLASYKIETTDIPESEPSNDISLSPNPASDYIDLLLDDVILSEAKDLKIYNSLGECVINESIHPMTSSHRMNIEHLPPGLYLISINNGKEMQTGSFIVLR